MTKNDVLIYFRKPKILTFSAKGYFWPINPQASSIKITIQILNNVSFVIVKPKLEAISTNTILDCTQNTNKQTQIIEKSEKRT